MITEIDNEFEKCFEIYYNRAANNYTGNFKSKFMKWVMRPNYLNKKSVEYRLHKSSLKLFFTNGILFYQKRMLQKVENDN